MSLDAYRRLLASAVLATASSLLSHSLVWMSSVRSPSAMCRLGSRVLKRAVTRVSDAELSMVILSGWEAVAMSWALRSLDSRSRTFL